MEEEKNVGNVIILNCIKILEKDKDVFARYVRNVEIRAVSIGIPSLDLGGQATHPPANGYARTDPGSARHRIPSHVLPVPDGTDEN